MCPQRSTCKHGHRSARLPTRRAVSPKLDDIEVKPLAPGLPFKLGGQGYDVSVTDFWRWSASDLLSNTLRGKLAEYIVAKATHSPQAVRREWDEDDIKTREGDKVEVKSSAYLQSWDQDRLSTIQFDIAKKFKWDASTNKFGRTKTRPADVYVFAILDHRDKRTVNPLNLDQWTFYVSPTSDLDKQLGEQKKAALSTVQRLTNNRAVKFNELGAEVRRCGSHAKP